jgi:hypothetical protein
MGRKRHKDRRKPLEEIDRGPSGGVAHQPGRGHDRKSAPERKKRFVQRQQRKRSLVEEELRRSWEEWDKLTEEQRRLLGRQPPNQPRPPDVHESEKGSSSTP